MPIIVINLFYKSVPVFIRKPMPNKRKGPPFARQRIAILMEFRRRADDGQWWPILNAGWVAENVIFEMGPGETTTTQATFLSVVIDHCRNAPFVF